MAVADAQNRRIDLGLLDLLPIDVSLMFGDVDDPPYRPQHAAIPLGEHMYAERIRPRVGRLVPCVRLIAAIHIAATGQREHGEYAAEQCANRSLQSPGNPAGRRLDCTIPRIRAIQAPSASSLLTYADPLYCRRFPRASCIQDEMQGLQLQTSVQTVQQCHHVLTVHMPHTLVTPCPVAIAVTLRNTRTPKPLHFLVMRCTRIHIGEAHRSHITQLVRLLSQAIQEGSHVLPIHGCHAFIPLGSIAVVVSIGNTGMGEPQNVRRMRRSGIHVGEPVPICRRRLPRLRACYVYAARPHDAGTPPCLASPPCS